jgi:hypothetical protein
MLVAVAATCTGAEPLCVAGIPATRTVPADTTISLGQSFTFRLESGDPCGKNHGQWEVFSSPWIRWATSDTNIVRVDTSGMVTGRALGDAIVFTPNSIGEAMVHVR